MKNLKVSVKLAISFAMVAVLVIITIGVGTISLRDVQAKITDFYNGPYVLRNTANQTRQQFERVQKMVFRACATTNYSVTGDSISSAAESADNVKALMETLHSTYTGDESVLTTLDGILDQVWPHQEKVLDLCRQNRNLQANNYMEDNVVPLLTDATVSLDLIIEHSQQEAERMLDEISSAQTKTVFLFLIMGGACVILAVFFNIYLTRSLTRPLSELKNATYEMSHGNLSAVVTYRSKDEIGQVSDSMRQMVTTLSHYIEDISLGMKELSKGNLNIAPTAQFEGDFIELRDSILLVIQSFNSTLAQINESADQVSFGSEQLSGGAQELSQGATQQASAVQQLAATINEISEQVRSNAENALQASSQAKSVGDGMAESNRQMQEMIQAMEQISRSSGEIGKIIKTIEDIAFQTNILALNAAVEAARAGAAGKGFAVVADEVRNLASKSAEASKNTSSLIEGSLRAVENGTRIADQTARSLVTAVDGAKGVASIVDRISSASQVQAQSITQITQGVEQISSVVQNNSATAEQSAAASEELSSQAQMLKTMVGRFRLKTSSAAVPGSLPAGSEHHSEATAAPAYDGSKY